MKGSFITLLMVCATMMSCAQQGEDVKPAEQPVPGGAWAKITPDVMTETQTAQYELCLAATNALAAELMGELDAALDGGDPIVAIDACRSKAPTIAAHISKEYGIRIGRTSHKLRNPVNTAPHWAEPLITELVDQPTYLAGPGGEFAALLPIKLKAACEMCHGPSETIDQDLLAAIQSTYKEDQATGFVEGDLRGWFWAEAPAGEET